MKKLLFALLLLATPAHADSGIRVAPCGHQQISTALSAATKLTIPATCNNPTAILVRTETQAVRFLDDGTAPTTTLGMPLLATDAPFWYEGNIGQIQFIAETDGAVLDVNFYQ
jgi:hypothetical protein